MYKAIIVKPAPEPKVTYWDASNVTWNNTIINNINKDSTYELYLDMIENNKPLLLPSGMTVHYKDA